MHLSHYALPASFLLCFLSNATYRVWEVVCGTISPLLTDETRDPVIGGHMTSYLSLRSTGSLSAQTVNSLDNTCHCLSQTWLPRAVIGRQWVTLCSSWQWAQTAQLLPVKADWQTGDRRRPSGHYDDRSGFDRLRQVPDQCRRVRMSKRPVQNDVAVQNNVMVCNDLAVQRDPGEFKMMWQFRTTGWLHNVFVDTAAELME